MPCVAPNRQEESFLEPLACGSTDGEQGDRRSHMLRPTVRALENLRGHFVGPRPDPIGGQPHCVISSFEKDAIGAFPLTRKNRHSNVQSRLGGESPGGKVWE